MDNPYLCPTSSYLLRFRIYAERHIGLDRIAWIISKALGRDTQVPFVLGSQTLLLLLLLGFIAFLLIVGKDKFHIVLFI